MTGLQTCDVVKHPCGCWGPGAERYDDCTPREAVVHPDHAEWHEEQIAAGLPAAAVAESLTCGCPIPREPYAPMPYGAGKDHHQHPYHHLWHRAQNRRART